MDSLTQLVLGAAVGEAALGKKVKNKALVWGGVAGTIPDLDVLSDFFLDDLQSLLFHRGITHSILFAVIVAPILAFLAYKWHSKEPADFKDWWKLFFLCIITHPLLDIFTNYGTQLFYPFSEYRISFNTIFVIDPLYTLPLLIGTILVFMNKKNSKRRKKINRIALILSSSYLLLTCINKLYVHTTVKDYLHAEEISFQDLMTTPAPLSNLLWSVIVKSEDRFYVGYYSVLERSDTLELLTLERDAFLLSNLLPDESVERLIKFSKGFYLLEKTKQGIIFNDLRFSTISGWFNINDEYVFSFVLKKEGENVVVKRKEPERNIEKSSFIKLFKRTMGKNVKIDGE